MQHTSLPSSAAQALGETALSQGRSVESTRGASSASRSVGPIRGLQELDRRLAASSTQQPKHSVDFDRKLGWSHAKRIERKVQQIRAETVAERPALRLDRARAACSSMTADLRTAVESAVILSICTQVAAQLKSAWPYRRSLSTWAGGNHYVTVEVGESPLAWGGSVPVWSDNGKWSGTNSFGGVEVTERCLREFGYNLILGGLVTVDAELVGAREYRVVWVEQSRGFDLKIVSGWLIRGYRVKARTLVEARRKADKARTLAVLRERASRLERDVASGRCELGQVRVRRSDSIDAGNCTSGTDAFIERIASVLDGRDDIAANELLRLERSSHTLAAVAFALARQQQAAEPTPVMGDEGCQ